MASNPAAAATRAYIALGANLGEPIVTLQRAIDAIGAIQGTRVVRRSAWYRTAPIGYSAQPDFINAVIAIDTTHDAPALLIELRAIEDRLGRTRSFANAPRTVDLDILLFGEEVQTSDALAVPHPRMHLRAFVLAPLIEIAPDIEIPGHGPARRLLERCKAQTVERIE